jgi:hypothetical protein
MNGSFSHKKTLTIFANPIYSEKTNMRVSKIRFDKTINGISRF